MNKSVTPTAFINNIVQHTNALEHVMYSSCTHHL